MKQYHEHLQWVIAAAMTLALTAGIARPAAAVQATLAADGYVVSGATGKTGAKTTLKVIEASSTTAFVRFDLSVLPDSVGAAQIAKATLRLFVQKLTMPGAVDVSTVTTDWSDADIGSVTPTLGSSVTTDTAVTDHYAWVSIDVTSAIQGWRTTPTSNHGLAIIPTTSSGIKAEFDSKESKTTSQAPQLEIVLSSTGPGSIASSDITFPNGGGDNTALGQGALEGYGGEANTAVGSGALHSVDFATDNTAVGYAALQSLTDDADFNTAVGYAALSTNTIGGANTAVGRDALSANTSGHYNTAVGNQALELNDDGTRNVAVGIGALEANVSGDYNTAIGQVALAASTGDYNTAVGRSALNDVTSGSANVGIGAQAGTGLMTGGSNIYIGAVPAGASTESNVTRIGTTAGAATYIGGIYSPTVSSRAVYVNSAGQLGTLSSSRRFKTDIRSIGGVSRKLLQLRPVSFRYKKEVEADGAVQFGLIAEEVATVFPELVELGKDGKPYTVRYHLLSALLLNEFQKQNTELQRQHTALEQVRVENAQLRAQVEEIGALKARLTAVEAALPVTDGHPALQAAAARGY